MRKLLTLLITIIALNSCKKTDSLIRQLPSSEAKSVVENWYKQFAGSVSETDNQRAIKLVTNLDYTSAQKITRSDNSVLYLIEITADMKIRIPRYLGIIKSSDKYALEGVYAARDVSSIAAVCNSRQLEGGDKVRLYNIRGFIDKGWQTDEHGISSIAKGEYRQTFVSVKQFRDVASLKSNTPKVNYMLEEEPCIYHYTIWYIEETGEIIDIEYNGRTGNCESDGSSGTGGEQNSCNLDDNGAQVVLDNGEVVEEGNNISGGGTGPIDETSQDMDKQDYLTKAFILEYGPYTDYKKRWYAGYSGKRFRFKNVTNDPWKWYTSPVFANSYFTDGKEFPCSETTVTITPSSTQVAPSELSAVVTFIWQRDTKVTCYIGYKVDSQHKTKSQTIYPQ